MSEQTADLDGPSGDGNGRDLDFSGLRGLRTHTSSPSLAKREALDALGQMHHLQQQQQQRGSPRRPYHSAAQQQHSGSVAAATAIALAAKAAAENAAGTPTARNNSFAAGSDEDQDDLDQDEDTDDGQTDGRKRKGTPLGNRAKKPHLQGRFSGRLPTKEDEKRLAEECKLLGPIIGGNGKRGDKSRLTLAKIVRGIASGDIRRYCEDRERLLQEARKVLSNTKHSGGTAQEMIDSLKRDNEIKTQRIAFLEKQLSLAKQSKAASSGPGGSVGAPQQHQQHSQQQHSQQQHPQSSSPRSLQNQAQDYAAQHRQALLTAKACFAQAQALALEQQQVESSMHALQVQVNELVQRREELKAEEVVQLQLLDSELSKVQLQAQRHAKALAEMREAGLKAEAQATAYAQSHAQIQQTLDQGGAGGVKLSSGSLFPESSGGQQLQQHQQHQQCWSLLPTSNQGGLDFAPPVRILEAGSGPSFGPRISLLDPLSTPRISLLDPLGTAPSLALGGGGHSLSGGRISASQLDMRGGGPAFYTLNMVPSASGLNGLNQHRLSHLGHQVSPNQQNLSLPVFQLGSLRQLGSVGVGMGMDGLGSMQAPGFDTSSAALGALGQSWGQAAAAAVAAATAGAGGHLGIMARGSSGSGSTIFGANLPGSAQQHQQQQQQHHHHQQQQQGAVLSLGTGATAGRLQLTGDGLPSSANTTLGLNLALPAPRKVEA